MAQGTTPGTGTGSTGTGTGDTSTGTGVTRHYHWYWDCWTPALALVASEQELVAPGQALTTLVLAKITASDWLKSAVHPKTLD